MAGPDAALAATLRRAPIFSGLNEADVQALAGAVQLREVAKGFMKLFIYACFIKTI